MKLKKSKPSKSSSVDLHVLGYRCFGNAPARIFPFSKKVRENLLRANIKINHVVYVSSMFFWGFIAFVLTFPLVFFLLEYFFPILKIVLPTLLSIEYSILIGVMAFGITLSTFLYYPSYVASTIKMKIEKNLVYVGNYMVILNGAGATPGETFRSLAEVGEVFGLKESARSIIKNVEMLGADLISALKEESRKTPSKEYSSFLQGYVATVQTGGDLKGYLLSMSRKFMDSRRRLLSRMIDQLGLAGEIYVTILVAFPIIMITLLSIMGFFGGEVIGGLSAAQVMPILVYLLVPFAAIGVLVFVDAIMSSW